MIAASLEHILSSFQVRLLRVQTISFVLLSGPIHYYSHRCTHLPKNLLNMSSSMFSQFFAAEPHSIVYNLTASQFDWVVYSSILQFQLQLCRFAQVLLKLNCDPGSVNLLKIGVRIQM